MAMETPTTTRPGKSPQGLDEMQAEVRRWLQLAPASAVYNPHTIRRSCLRREWPIPFELIVRNRFGKEMTVIATARDLSERGVMLFCRLPQRNYETLLLRPDPSNGEFRWVKGRVAHCTQSVGLYKIGVEFLELDSAHN